ncbi:MAG: response regulator transcription factor [Pseudomonadota bacterium]
MTSIPTPKRVLIADDHDLVRSGLRELFLAMKGVEIVGEAADGLEAMTLARTLKPDLMTLDSGMPLARGVEVYSEVRRWCPDTRIIVITGFTALGQLADWIDAGVDGLFLKTCSPGEMRTGFELVLQGGVFVSKAVIGQLEARAQTSQLTARERQILHLISEGFSNAEIGDRLAISAKTVDNHRTRMMAKLNVHSLAQLLAFALKEGLLDPNSQL